MGMVILKLNLFLSLLSRTIILLLLIVSLVRTGNTQCLSSVNPVGGTENLLVLEKKSFRYNAFYRYGQGNQYYEGTEHSDFDLIDRAWYNYLSASVGYGFTNKFTLEAESGFFINKTQAYNVQSGYRLRGWGLNSLTLLGKFNLFSNFEKRSYLALAGGVKIPCRRNMQTVNHVQLPIEIQPSSGAFGLVLHASWVKEYSRNGMRFFVTNRTEVSGANIDGYRIGPSTFSSVFISKHLMAHWIPGHWTTIFQIRNEIRGKDWTGEAYKQSSGSVLFFLAPQLNYSHKEKLNFSFILDVPVFQNFNGTQLGAGLGGTFSISQTISPY
jgi:hypothetical protein